MTIPVLKNIPSSNIDYSSSTITAKNRDRKASLSNWGRNLFFITFVGLGIIPLSGCEAAKDLLESIPLLEITSKSEQLNLETDEKTDLPAPPIARVSAHHYSIDDKLYRIGGLDEHLNIKSEVEIYDTNKNQWSMGTPWPSARPTAFYQWNKKFCAGPTNQQPFKDSTYVKQVDCYDTEKNEWIVIDIPDSIPNKVDLTTTPNKLILIDTSENDSQKLLWEYDESKKEWQTLPSTPTIYGVEGTFLYEKQLVVLARLKKASPSNVPPTHALIRFDPEKKSWGDLIPMPEGTNYNSTVFGDHNSGMLLTHGGKIIEKGEFYRWNEDDKKWEKGSYPDVQGNPAIFDTFHFKDKLYMRVFISISRPTGSDISNRQYQDKLLEYNPKANSWTLLKSWGGNISSNRLALFSVINNDKLYFIGGTFRPLVQGLNVDIR
jgi:hypothetical protein